MSTLTLTNLRVAVYARYSSDQQREASIDDQVRRCREHIERAGGKVDLNLIFADYATSGASLQRPAFEKMMALVHAKRRGVDVIVTEDISRISRDSADSAIVLRDLQFYDVPLIGITDGIDTSEPSGDMNYVMRSVFAQTYLRDLSKKTLRGLEGRALAGFSTGGLPFGYTSAPETDAMRRVVGHAICIVTVQGGVVRA